MTDFGFIVGMVTIYQFLHRLHGPTIKLQGRSMDIVQAYEQMDDLKKDCRKMRNNVDEDFKVVYTLVIKHIIITTEQPLKSFNIQRSRESVLVSMSSQQCLVLWRGN